MGRILSLDDFDPAAKALLPRMIHGYIVGAVETGRVFRLGPSLRGICAYPACPDGCISPTPSENIIRAALFCSLRDLATRWSGHRSLSRRSRLGGACIIGQ